MTETVDDPAFWAVVEHHRLWWAMDGPCRKKVEKDGKLADDVARVIARDYGVARTIGALKVEGSDPIPGLPDLVRDINESDWPSGLGARADQCMKLATGHAKRCSGKTPISAVTKLMWFLRPGGWTMFDTYARHGLIGHKNDVAAFYAALVDAGFQGRCEAIKARCNDHGFGELWGERIIDKFLMLHGAQRKDKDGRRFYARSRWMNEAYLAMLPREARGHMTALGNEVRGLLTGGKNPLLVWGPRQRRAQRQEGGK
jgi:hypothetical protein